MRDRAVLLIASTTGYQIRSFGTAATALGVHLILASDRCDHLDDPWSDGAIPVRFHDVDGSIRQLVAALGDRRPAGIVAVGDRPSVFAAHAAAALGVIGNAPAAAERSRNKLESKAAFSAAGLPVPAFASVAIETDPHSLVSSQTYPIVIKPLALSGSRGVMRADNPEQFVSAFTRLRRLLQSPDIQMEHDAVHRFAMIESFIPGREHAVEGILTHGRFHALAMFDKPDPLDGPFFEETIYVTPSRAVTVVQDAIIGGVAAAARALGLVHGPVHAECRVDNRDVYVLEVAARPIGGLCARVLGFSEGARAVSLEELLLRHATGERIEAIDREPGAAGVMMIPIPSRGVFKGVRGLDDARAVPLIEDVVITAKADAMLTPLPEGRSYLGFIFSRGHSPEAVECALREAHRQLRFSIDREVPLAGE